MITVYKAGTPVPQPRARHVKKGARTIVTSTVDTRAKKYRAGIEQAIKDAMVAAGHAEPMAACSVQIEFFFATDRAERWDTPHTTTPDLDNLAKLWMDVAKGCGLLQGDDARVGQLRLSKVWAPKAGVIFTVQALKAADLTPDDPEDLGAASI